MTEHGAGRAEIDRIGRTQPTIVGDHETFYATLTRRNKGA